MDGFLQRFAARLHYGMLRVKLWKMENALRSEKLGQDRKARLQWEATACYNRHLKD